LETGAVEGNRSFPFFICNTSTQHEEPQLATLLQKGSDLQITGFIAILERLLSSSTNSDISICLHF
jgi:hypothetical protein